MDDPCRVGMYCIIYLFLRQHHRFIPNYNPLDYIIHRNIQEGENYLEDQGIAYETTWDKWQNILALVLLSTGALSLAYIQLRRINKYRWLKKAEKKWAGQRLYQKPGEACDIELKLNERIRNRLGTVFWLSVNAHAMQLHVNVCYL